MIDIDDVQAGKARARVGSEFVSMADFESLVRMIEIAATGLGARDGWRRSSMKLMDTLHRRGRTLLKARRAHR
jgi:hypothetical protein